MRSIDGLKIREDRAETVKVKKNVVKNTTVLQPKKEVQKKTAQKVAPKPVQQVAPEDIIQENETNEENESVIQAHEDFVNDTEYDFDLTSDDVKEEIKNSKKDKKKKKEKKKVSVARKVITSILLIIVLGVLGVFVWGMVWGNDVIAKITGGNSNIFDVIHLISDDKLVDLKADEFGRTNILIFGTSGFDMEGNEGEGVHDGAALTDSIMILSFDQKTYDVAMVNLPRDLKAGATCTATGKVNEVYWCNNMYGDNEEAGANALADKMKEILGVDIQYYVHINWGTVITLVDSLGGIDVTLDEDIDDYYYTGAVYQAGVPYHLDGWNAVALARARHGTGGGDFSRGNSQQKIIMAIKDKLMANGIGWTKALDIINSLGDNFRTNITLPEMKTGLWLVGEMDLNSMRQVPLVDYENNVYHMTTAMINGISYVIPADGADNYYRLQQYIREQFSTPEKEAVETGEE